MYLQAVNDFFDKGVDKTLTRLVDKHPNRVKIVPHWQKVATNSINKV